MHARILAHVQFAVRQLAGASGAFGRIPEARGTSPLPWPWKARGASRYLQRPPHRAQARSENSRRVARQRAIRPGWAISAFPQCLKFVLGRLEVLVDGQRRFIGGDRLLLAAELRE